MHLQEHPVLTFNLTELGGVQGFDTEFRAILTAAPGKRHRAAASQIQLMTHQQGLPLETQIQRHQALTWYAH